MGTGLNDAKQVGAMVVDVGGGTTDIAVLCDTGVVVSESLRIGGDSFNEIYYSLHPPEEASCHWAINSRKD